MSGFFVAYLRRQVELGRLRVHDPQSRARSFFGMLLVYILSQEVFLHLREGLPDKEQYVTLSTFSWTGYARIEKGQP